MYPKQLLPLVTGESTMLQDTAQRLDGMSGLRNECLVICNEAHRFLVAEQMRQIGRSTTVVLEPEGRIFRGPRQLDQSVDALPIVMACLEFQLPDPGDLGQTTTGRTCIGFDRFIGFVHLPLESMSNHII